LLEGELLRDVLNRGALPVRKAVEYGLQIAQGLAAAHGQGVVHRDLKPENLFVTKDGRVKILDFGLAKLRADRQSRTSAVKSGSAADAVTVIDQTEPGLVLGTPGYMSPEQVRGEPIDARSDLFAFGLILYEMLSGRRAFAKASGAETMTAILNEEPPDLLQSQPTVPASLDRIVQRCLEKNPDRRFQSASDLAFALESSTGSSASDRRAIELAAPPSRTKRWLAIGAGAIGFTLMGLIAGLFVRQLLPSSSATFQQITSRRGTIFHARFGTDGHSILYSAR
jgi:serine/threonine protein kinase